MLYEHFSLCIQDAANIIFISFISIINQILTKIMSAKSKMGLKLVMLLIVCVSVVSCGNKGPLTHPSDKPVMQKKQVKE